MASLPHVDEFVALLSPMAQEIGLQYGIDPALIISQAAIESGWGNSVKGNNYFGVKSHGQDGGQQVMTHEEVNGKLVPMYQDFRKYDGLRGSMEDYAKFLSTEPRYADVFRSGNLNDQINAIGSSGYATDSGYGDKLRSVSRMITSRMAPTPPGELPQVATQLDVRRPVTGAPATMPASLGAQRQLTAQLQSGQTTAPGSDFYGGIYRQPTAPPQQPVLRPFDPERNTPRPNADGSISTELTRTVQFPDGSWGNVPSLWWGNGSNNRNLDSMGDDELAQFASRYESQSGQKFPRYTSLQQAETQAQQRSDMGAGTNGSITSRPRPRNINSEVSGAQSGQDPALAAALQQFVNRPPPYNAGTTVASISTRPPAVMKQPTASERAALAAVPSPRVPYSQGQTIASVPTRPQLPPVAPSRTASPRVFSETTARTAAANQPALQAALQARVSSPPPRQPNAAEKAALAFVPPPTVRASPRQPTQQERLALAYAPPKTVATVPTTSRIGHPPATRVVPSVPVPATPRPGASSVTDNYAYNTRTNPRPSPTDPIGSMGTFADMQALAGPRIAPIAPITSRIPGPNEMPKGQERLTPQGALPLNVPGAIPRVPPIMIGPALQRQVTPPGWPTAASQRPTYQQPVQAPRPVARNIFAMPTPLAQRPTGRAPLNVVVQGANTQQPGSSGSSSSPTQGYSFQGQQVYATPTKRYNTDTNSFETVTTYKPR